MNEWKEKCAWPSPAAGLMVLCALATAASASGEVNVEKLDGAEVTRLIVHAGDGSVTQGTVATGSLGPAVIYDTEPSGYISGCWSHGCMVGFADEMRFANFPAGGGELSSYTFSYAAGYGFLYEYCVPGDPGGGDCGCYCPTGGECDEGDPPYRVDAALYDGPPGFCGGGLPIAGTEAEIATTASRRLGDELIEVTVHLDPKVFVPSEVWGVVTLDIEDAWLSIGTAPTVGSTYQDGALWIDSDFDGCWDAWECWGDPFGWTCPGCTGWMHFEAKANAEVEFSLVPVPPPPDSEWADLYTYAIDGVEAFLAEGGEPVWMEIWVSDFDPNQAGVLVKAWQATIGSSSFSSGMQGTLDLPPCTDHSDCASFGPTTTCDIPTECTDLDPDLTCEQCAAVGYPCACTFGFIDKGRTDYIFFGQYHLNGMGIRESGYAFGAAVQAAPIASPGRESYLATMMLWVPDDAKGTFTIDLVQVPDTHIADSDGFIPFIALRPAKVTIEVGRCCYDLLSQPGGCEDGLTANECAANPGPVRLFPGETCADGCPPSGACCDGTTGDCQENLLESECPDVPQSRWVKATRCQDLDPPCEEHTGACCVEGVCTDDVPQSECASDKWFKHTPCSDPEVRAVCLAQWAVPAVSAWGVVIIALLIAAFGKAYFGRRAGIVSSGRGRHG